MKFPAEHFEELYRDKYISLIDRYTKAYGLESLQPNLFNRGTWRTIYESAQTDNALTIASVVTAWGFTKISYRCAPELIDEIAGSDLEDFDKRLDLLFKFVGCVYFEGSGFWWKDLDVQGYWTSVQNNGDGSGSILWVLNSIKGLIPVELAFDERGLDAALYDYASTGEDFIRGLLGSKCTDESYELSCRLWLGGIMSEIRLMYYLLSTNAEFSGDQGRGKGYQLGAMGQLIVPGKMLQISVGDSIGKKIKDDGVLKNAHWELLVDGALVWLCGADSRGFDYSTAQYCEEIDTDEDLVAMNQGRNEDEFSVTLTEEESRRFEAGEITEEELRAITAERVHRARSNIAAKNGEVYDRVIYENPHV